MEIGVINKEDGKWTKVKYTKSKINDVNFDISTAASELDFASLPKGTYYYRINVYTEDTEKATKLVNQQFNVAEEVATVKLSGANYPTSFTEGTSFYVQGSITSDQTIKRVKVGIVSKKTGGWAYVYDNAKVNAKSFNLKAADSTLLFSKLGKGQYFYRIIIQTQYGSQTVLDKEFTVNAKITLAKGNYINGIDVSTFQGNIDWTKVKNSGIEFAIIRAGFRGYTTGSLATDNKFVKNMKNAKAAGLKVGVYFFSQAVNYNEGVAEANYVCDLLEKNGFKVDFPIAVDTEYINSKRPGRADRITKAQRTEAVQGFCDQVKKRGYEPMIYASTSWYSSQLDMTKLSGIKLWAAQWSSTVPSGRNYVCWQYSSDGRVPGISGRVDMNRWFK